MYLVMKIVIQLMAINSDSPSESALTFRLIYELFELT
jgi:hypothetical protein